MRKIGEENKALNGLIERLADENKALSGTIEKLVIENIALSGRVERLVIENIALSGRVERLVIENIALSGRVEILVNENKALSWKDQVHDRELANTQSENKELSKLMKRQTKEITTLRNDISHVQTQISKNTNPSQSDNSKSRNNESGYSKRIVLHSDTDILRLVTTHSTEIQKLQTDVAALQSGLPKGGSGSAYVRWGRNNCSGNGTELVYSGYAAGSDYRNTGGAANYICLSPDPIWGHYNDAHDAAGTVFGVEYQFEGAMPGYDTTTFFHKKVHDEDAPCSVCRSRRSTVIMIPGRNHCYIGWTLEYKGYLVSSYYGHTAAGEYVCLDDHPDVIPGGHTNQDGKLFYLVEGRCGSLTCPPYVDGRELTCVVCSK